ncbi:uncharacterized protein LOC126336584 [Schistocerca gregaria]|uniref:uncharacterized protein LOC126336584 n=1 Tax=Schistocerca gregaria TaxID=7010 RepID=UPI00211F13FC|nr:uncharacterized protein LOC126336584 [Schistocerca gregaria]
MMKSSVVVLLLAAAVSAWPYPRYEEVVRDPKTSDLLYGTNSGIHVETWYFNTQTYLTSIIIPSQIINFCGSDTLSNGTYEEEVELRLFEWKLSVSPVQTYMVASGSFKGTARHGQELDIPLTNGTQGHPPRVEKYQYSTSGPKYYKYTLDIVFKTTGIYPWYTTRYLSSYSPINSLTNEPGIAIGLSYAI